MIKANTGLDMEKVFAGDRALNIVEGTGSTTVQ
jgi:hypothetical protein